MRLTRVIMRLARNPGVPEGDDSRGYVIVAPLDSEGRFDAALWREHKEACTVRRFSPDKGEIADGWLTNRGGHWYFHYDEAHEGPDEPVYRLADHQFRVGDYVAVREKDGDTLTYKVTETQKVH
jgi:hypothetical protein